MATSKSKKPDFVPNPYEGFRATTRESGGWIEVYMSMTGNQGTVQDVLIAKYDTTLAGRGRADMLFLFVQVIAIILNSGMHLGELAEIWEHLQDVSRKYSVTLPEGWTLMTIAGLNLNDYQVIYVHEATDRVAIVEPDVQTTLATLDDVVFEGGHSVVTPGRRTEVAKIQHQPHRGEAEGNS